MALDPTPTLDVNGAELIVRFLEAHGVTHVFAAPPSAAGALLPLRRALADARLTQVFAAQEQSVGHIAQGYARSSGRAGVCLANAGAGVTQMLTVIADAQADAVPLVVICGENTPGAGVQTRRGPGLRAGHVVDTLTKTHFEVRAVDDLVDVLPEAFRIAESGRPGPVVIVVPASAQTARIKLHGLPRAAAIEAGDQDDLRPDWHAHLAELRRARCDDDRARSRSGLIRTVAQTLGDDAIVVCDGGEVQRWIAQDYPRLRADRWLTSGELGISGFALPAAIGAALARPGLPVVAFCDAAGTLPQLQALATLDDLQLDVKLVLLDAMAVALRHGATALAQPRRYLGPLAPRTSGTCALAESFGVPVLDLGRTGDPLSGVREALRQPGPVLIRTPSDQLVPLLPRAVPTRARSARLH
ncbi:thiamine pyrophosphate-binding protein [Fontimonas sp. SYSU GA230001]|uniref:thiamine pyrophosphate-binding protein n=1 Tax=Fontimonas sp. SYSU GA230001 TaxID=3142450 RepID=UPI0032B5EF02